MGLVNSLDLRSNRVDLVSRDARARSQPGTGQRHSIAVAVAAASAVGLRHARSGPSRSGAPAHADAEQSRVDREGADLVADDWTSVLIRTFFRSTLKTMFLANS
jgi:hypothetical protein